MLWMLALLGLGSAAFVMSDIDPVSSEGEEDVDTADTNAADATTDTDGSTPLDFLDDIAATDAGGEDDGEDTLGDPITPNDPEAPATAGPTGSPDDDVLVTNDPEEAATAGPTGSPDDDILDPNGTDDNVTGDGSGDVVTHTLDDTGETFVLADDAQQGGTDATLTTDAQGNLTLSTEGTLNLVTGGAGDDVIATGDDAAIVAAGAGNDTIYGGDGSAILDGGTGDDTLFAGRDGGSEYVLTGGEGLDSFGVSYDSAQGTPSVEITDFVLGEDIITISIDAVTAAIGPVDVSIETSTDGLSSEIVVNGEVVASVNGVNDLDVTDIVVVGV